MPGRSIRSGGLERSCAAARGTITMTTRAVPTATGIIPTIATTTSVFGSCCVLPRSSRPSSGPAAARDGAPVHPYRLRSSNAGRSARVDLPAEAKEEEQRQIRLVRAQAARQGNSGRCPRRAHSKIGRGQAIKPAVARPTFHASQLTRFPLKGKEFSARSAAHQS